MSSERPVGLILMCKFLEKKENTHTKEPQATTNRKVNLCLKLTSALKNQVVLRFL